MRIFIERKKKWFKAGFKIDVSDPQTMISSFAYGYLANFLARYNFVGLTAERKEKKEKAMIIHELMHVFTLIILELINTILIQEKNKIINTHTLSILNEVITVGINQNLNNHGIESIGIKWEDFFKTEFALNLAQKISAIFKEKTKVAMESIKLDKHLIIDKVGNQVKKIIFDYDIDEPLFSSEIAQEIIKELSELYDKVIKDEGLPSRFDTSINKMNEKARYILMFLNKKGI